GALLPDHHVAVCRLEREGAQQQRVDDREDGRVRADAERNGQHGHRREDRILPEHARGVAQAFQKRAHQTYLNSIAELEADVEKGRRGDWETFDDADSVSLSPLPPLSPSALSVRMPR